MWLNWCREQPWVGWRWSSSFSTCQVTYVWFILYYLISLLQCVFFQFHHCLVYCWISLVNRLEVWGSLLLFGLHLKQQHQEVALIQSYKQQHSHGSLYKDYLPCICWTASIYSCFFSIIKIKQRGTMTVTPTDSTPAPKHIQFLPEPMWMFVTNVWFYSRSS